MPLGVPNVWVRFLSFTGRCSDWTHLWWWWYRIWKGKTIGMWQQHDWDAHPLLQNIKKSWSKFRHLECRHGAVHCSPTRGMMDLKFRLDSPCWCWWCWPWKGNTIGQWQQHDWDAHPSLQNIKKILEQFSPFGMQSLCCTLRPPHGMTKFGLDSPEMIVRIGLQYGVISFAEICYY